MSFFALVLVIQVTTSLGVIAIGPWVEVAVDPQDKGWPSYNEDGRGAIPRRGDLEELPVYFRALYETPDLDGMRPGNICPFNPIAFPPGGLEELGNPSNPSSAQQICQEAVNRVGVLPGSQRIGVVPTVIPSALGFTLSIPLLLERPRFSFWANVDDLSTTDQFFLQVQALDALGNPAVALEATLDGENIANLGWRRFTLNLQGVFDGFPEASRAFIFSQLRTTNPNTSPFIARMFAFDQFELVGPGLDAEVYSQRGFAAVDVTEVQIPRSRLGFILTIVLPCVVAVFFVAILWARNDETRLERVSLMWKVTATAFVIYAIFETFQIEDSIEKIANQTSSQRSQVTEAVDAGSNFIDSLGFRESSVSTLAYFSVSFPAFTPLTALEKYFEFREDSRPTYPGGKQCELETCVSRDAFLALDGTVLTLTGSIFPSQDHLLFLIQLNLVLDAVVTLVAWVVGKWGSFRMNVGFHVVALPTGWALTFALLYFGLREPVRYHTDLVLKEFGTSTATAVVPKKISSDEGNLFVDVGETVYRCVADLPGLNDFMEEQLQSALNFELTAFDRFKVPSEQTCDYSAVVPEYDNLCVAINCPGRIPMSYARDTDAQLEFAFETIVLGAVLLDVLVTAMDTLVFIIYVRQRRKQLESTEGKTVQANIATQLHVDLEDDAASQNSDDWEKGKEL